MQPLILKHRLSARSAQSVPLQVEVLFIRRDGGIAYIMETLGRRSHLLSYFDVFTAYWSLKTVSNTLPFSPTMQIKFFVLLDVLFSIEASPSTTALISTPQF